MATNNQKEQLKGYVQAIEDLHSVILLYSGSHRSVGDVLTDVENDMRGKAIKLVKQMED